jgi:hypothetical protein
MLISPSSSLHYNTGFSRFCQYRSAPICSSPLMGEEQDEGEKHHSPFYSLSSREGISCLGVLWYYVPL